MKKISLIIPVFNEEESLAPFIKECMNVVNRAPEYIFEYVFVNDGSNDNTLPELIKMAKENQNIRIVHFSRNFGKEKAMMAGLENTLDSDAVIITDVDLQDPPSVMLDFIKKWEQGHNHVYGVRSNRKTDSFFKRLMASFFYFIFNLFSSIKIPPHAGDFRLLSQPVVQVLAQIKTKHLFMKGLYVWAGYSPVGIEYVRQKRHTGKSRFSFFKLLALSLDGIFTFSSSPLKFSSLAGILISLCSFGMGVFIILKKLLFGNPVPGYTSVMVSILFFCGLQLICIGILGEYVARIYDEVKKEPPFIVESVFSYPSKNQHD